MDLIESTSFEKVDPSGSPLSGLFFIASRLLGKDGLDNFVYLYSDDNVQPKKGNLKNLIDANTETNYESGKEDDSSLYFYFPHQKIKLTYYSFSSENEKSDFTPFINWSIYGSYDNINWITLDCHKNQTSLQKPSTSQIFKITNQEYFKIIKISSPDIIALSAVEFFGYAEKDKNTIELNIKPDSINNDESNQHKINSLNNLYTHIQSTTNENKLTKTAKKSNLQVFTPKNQSDQINIEWHDEIIETPKISPNLESTMSMNFSTSDEPSFYHGLFSIIKSKFYCSALKCGFVQIIADTKKRESINTESLVDCNKDTDWFSTKKERPSITLFFPFHVLTVDEIGLRSHNDHRFGEHFMSKFIVEGLNLNQEWVLLRAFDIKKLCGYVYKTIISVYSRIEVKAIRIRNIGKFGLSYIDLFGKAIYSPIYNQFNKKLLTSTSLSVMKDPNVFKKAYIDCAAGQKSTTHKILGIFKKKNPNFTDNVPKWNDDSDLENSDPNIEEMDFIAKDPNGPSLIETYEKITGSNAFLFSSNSGLISKKFNYDPNPKEFIRIDFKYLLLHLTGIKIKTCDSDNFLPIGFIIGGISSENKNEEQFEFIISTHKEQLQKNTEYYLPIKNTKFFSSFVICSYNQQFKIQFLEFYGNIKYSDYRYLDKNIFELYKKNEEPAFLPLFICDPVPDVDSYDPSGPSIFQQMEKFYGPLLNGFLRIFLINKKNTKVYYNEGVQLKVTSNKNPVIVYQFNQHHVKLLYLKVKATKNGNCLSNFLIASKQNIIAKLSHDFKPNEEFIFNIDNTIFCRYIYIYNLDGPFEIDEIEFYGELKEEKLLTKFNDDENFGFDNEPIKKYYMDKKEQDHIGKYEEEINQAFESNPEILFSVENGKNDICSIGSQRYRNFVEFWCCGKNGMSILYHNEDNLWLSTDDNGINSFNIHFPNHSIRLTRFVLCTPKDPRFVEFMPDTFFLYGYSSRAKRWDILYHRSSENQLEFMNAYSFKIENETKKNFYRTILFTTLTGRVAISYMKFFGDVKEDKMKIPEDVTNVSIPSISFKNMPSIIAHNIPNKFSHGLFEKAIPIFGPKLKNFVVVFCKTDEYSKFFDIWNARNSSFTSVDRDSMISISFYFPNHDIFIEGYQIRPDRYPNLERWAIVGYQTPNSKGDILSTPKRKKFTSFDSYYSFDVNNEIKNSYRIIRFVGLNNQFSFKLFDIFGIATPGENDPFGKNFKIPPIPTDVEVLYYRYN